jgi:hypothetical protein
VNAVPGPASVILELVRNNGRLAIITSDPPASVRGIQVKQIYVAPDGARLRWLVAMLAAGALQLAVSAAFTRSPGRPRLSNTYGGVARAAHRPRDARHQCAPNPLGRRGANGMQRFSQVARHTPLRRHPPQMIGSNPTCSSAAPESDLLAIVD